jgi:hypothetical protein
MTPCWRAGLAGFRTISPCWRAGLAKAWRDAEDGAGGHAQFAGGGGGFGRVGEQSAQGGEGFEAGEGEDRFEVGGGGRILGLDGGEHGVLLSVNDRCLFGIQYAL